MLSPMFFELGFFTGLIRPKSPDSKVTEAKGG